MERIVENTNIGAFFNDIYIYIYSILRNINSLQCVARIGNNFDGYVKILPIFTL